MSRGLSLHGAAEASGLHFSYWSKLENGVYDAPAPKHLQVIARTLGVDFEDLYALAGYDVPERLPTFKPYLRAKYELPPEAVADLERYFEMLRNYYDVPKDKPVFPPKGKATRPSAADLNMQVVTIQQFCDQKTASFPDRPLLAERRGQSVNLIEVDEDAPVVRYNDEEGVHDEKETIRTRIAKLTYAPERRTWQLYWMNHNNQPLRYDEPSQDVEALLHKIEEDRDGCFFG